MREDIAAVLAFLACVLAGALLAALLVVVPILCIFLGFDADAWWDLLVRQDKGAVVARFWLAIPIAAGMFFGFVVFAEGHSRW